MLHLCSLQPTTQHVLWDFPSLVPVHADMLRTVCGNPGSGRVCQVGDGFCANSPVVTSQRGRNPNDFFFSETKLF